MENKKKSFFDEVGFKPTITKLVDLIAKLYLEDENPWVEVILEEKIVLLVYN